MDIEDDGTKKYKITKFLPDGYFLLKLGPLKLGIILGDMKAMGLLSILWRMLLRSMRGFTSMGYFRTYY